MIGVSAEGAKRLEKPSVRIYPPVELFIAADTRARRN
jgi:hypothetical protein